MVWKCKLLNYLDDTPVFKNDRRYYEAYFRGGLPEERKERKKVREEERAEKERQHRLFRESCEKWKQEAEERDRQKDEARR